MPNDGPEPSTSSRHKKIRVAAASLGGMVIAATVSYLVPAAFRSVSERNDPPPISVATEQISPYAEKSWFIPGVTAVDLGRPSPGGCGTQTWADAYKARGASAAGGTFVLITVTSTQDVTAVIEGMSVTRGPKILPPGVVVTCPKGGAIDERVLDIDLDEDVPRARYISENGEAAERFAFSLKKGEVERFFVRAHSEAAPYRWTARITVLVGTDRTNYAGSSDLSGV